METLFAESLEDLLFTVPQEHYTYGSSSVQNDIEIETT